MRPELAEFLLRICDAANIPGSLAEAMVEAKHELRVIKETGNAKAKVSPFNSKAEANILGK